MIMFMLTTMTTMMMSTDCHHHHYHHQPQEPLSGNPINSIPNCHWNGQAIMENDTEQAWIELQRALSNCYQHNSYHSAVIMVDEQNMSMIETKIPIQHSSSPSVAISSKNDITNEDNRPYPDLSQILFVRMIFFILYLMVMISAFIGNVLIAYIVLSNRKMRTVVYYYIVNLAICDILISIFVLPSKVLELLAPSEWFVFNDKICMVISCLQTVVVFASVLTIVATCFERYFAIVHPLKSRMQQGRKRTCRILIAVWTISAIVSIPYLIKAPVAKINELKSEYGTISRLTCLPNFDSGFRMAYFTFLFVGLYLIPLALIGFTCFCIARAMLRTSVLHRQGSLLRQEVNRRKIGKMILMVVLCFTISWTPYFLVTVITQYQKENFLNNHDFYFTMLCINLFAFVHSSINPVIYLTMNARFQRGFVEIVRFIFCCQPMPENTCHTTSIPDPGTSSRCSHNGIAPKIIQA